MNTLPVMPDAAFDDQVDDIAALLRALANPQRLRLVRELMAGECGVGALEEVTGIRQPALSKELGKLREAGVIEGRRESKAVFYRLADDRAASVIAAVTGGSSPEPAVPRHRPPSPERGSMFARIISVSP